MQGSKKFKRLKKAGRNNEHEDRSGFTDDEEINEIDRSGRTAEEKLKRSLFGDDEGNLIFILEGISLTDLGDNQRPPRRFPIQTCIDRFTCIWMCI